MAIARCANCGKPRYNKSPAYSDTPYQPVGHPRSGIVCGTVGCEEAGLIWLKLDEERYYRVGQRVFDIRTHSAKVRLS